MTVSGLSPYVLTFMIGLAKFLLKSTTGANDQLHPTAPPSRAEINPKRYAFFLSLEAATSICLP